MDMISLEGKTNFSKSAFPITAKQVGMEQESTADTFKFDSDF